MLDAKKTKPSDTPVKPHESTTAAMPELSDEELKVVSGGAATRVAINSSSIGIAIGFQF